MLYLTLGFVILVLGLLPLYDRVLSRQPSKQRSLAVHKTVEREIALGEWGAALAALKGLLHYPQKHLKTHLLHLQILIALKRLDEAVVVANEALVQFPNDLGLLKEKGRVLLELGQANEALEALRLAKPVLRGEEELLDLGAALYQANEIEEAWEAIKDHALESCNGRLLALAGDCQFHWKNYPLAIDFYQQAQHYGWSNYRTLSRVAHGMRCSGNQLEAERIFRMVLSRDSGDVTATLGLGACLEERGLFRRALLVYQSGHAWDQAHPLVLRQAGLCCVQTGQFDYAALYLNQAIEAHAGSAKTLAFLGYALEKQRKWEEAEAVYLQLVDQYPSHPAGYRALAWLYGVGLSANLTAERGLSIAHQALQLSPDAVAWELLSACEARAGNWGRARDIQEQLSSQATDRTTRLRRRAAMRAIRQKIPLSEQLVKRTQVA